MQKTPTADFPTDSDPNISEASYSVSSILLTVSAAADQPESTAAAATFSSTSPSHSTPSLSGCGDRVTGGGASGAGAGARSGTQLVPCVELRSVAAVRSEPLNTQTGSHRSRPCTSASGNCDGTPLVPRAARAATEDLLPAVTAQGRPASPVHDSLDRTQVAASLSHDTGQREMRRRRHLWTQPTWGGRTRSPVRERPITEPLSGDTAPEGTADRLQDFEMAQRQRVRHSTLKYLDIRVKSRPQTTNWKLEVLVTFS